MVCLQISGEAAFKWRDSYGQHCKVFNLLQRSILPLGYQLTASTEERVGKVLSERISIRPTIAQSKHAKSKFVRVCSIAKTLLWAQLWMISVRLDSLIDDQFDKIDRHQIDKKLIAFNSFACRFWLQQSSIRPDGNHRSIKKTRNGKYFLSFRYTL